MAGAAVMYMSYDLSHYLDGDISRSTSITVSDDDAINCAHMLAAGFNTISRKMMGDFVLAVVDTKAGTVQYDGKIEQIERPDPHTVSTSFKFEASTDADTMVTVFDNENGRLMFPGKLKFAETDETTSAVAAETVASKINRKVLEEAYIELHRVKDVLFGAGVETIPADAGVRDLLAMKRAMSEQIEKIDRPDPKHEDLESLALETVPIGPECFASTSGSLICWRGRNYIPQDEYEAHMRARNVEISELVQERANANAAARAELIEHVKRAYAKWGQVDPGRQNESLKSNLRGMIEVLSKFLAATGEADADERHAVAKRLCDIPEGSYLYED